MLASPSPAAAQACEALLCVGGALQTNQPPGSLGIGYGGAQCNAGGTDQFFHLCGYYCCVLPPPNSNLPCLEWCWSSDQTASCRENFVRQGCTSPEEAYRDDTMLQPKDANGVYLNWPDNIGQSKYGHSKCQYKWASGPGPSISGGGFCCPNTIAYPHGAVCEQCKDDGTCP